MNILSFSGMIPEQVCDTVRFVSYPGKRRIAHYCGYAADFISQVVEDSRIDGAVFPRSCDSCRSMPSYLAGCGKFVFQMSVPTRMDEAAEAYLAAEIRRYRGAVQAHYGAPLGDMRDRAARVNERNRALAQLYRDISQISYGAWLDMLHGLLQTPLQEQTVPANLPGKPLAGGRRVWLIGSTLSDGALAAAVERAGMRIVGDRLTQSRRLFAAPPVRVDGDIYKNVAQSMLQGLLSPTQNRFDAILREDSAELTERQVEGVVFVTQKYCEPYDYLFPAYFRMLEELGIPSLRIVRTDSTDNRHFEAALEAFAETM